MKANVRRNSFLTNQFEQQKFKQRPLVGGLSVEFFSLKSVFGFDKGWKVSGVFNPSYVFRSLHFDDANLEQFAQFTFKICGRLKNFQTVRQRFHGISSPPTAVASKKLVANEMIATLILCF